jgi:VanZ family protein
MKSKNLHHLHKSTSPPATVSWLSAWGPALVWSATIFVLSSLPGSAYPHTDLPNADKLVHLVLYATLGAACGRALVLRLLSPQRPAMIIGIAAALATVYGVTDELHQLFVAGRSADWRDALTDAGGALLGAALAVTLWSRRRRRVRVRVRVRVRGG